MWKKWLGLIMVMLFAWGCTQFAHKEEIVYDQGKLQKFTYMNDATGPNANKMNSSGFMDAIRVIREVDEAALPGFGELPTPSERPRQKPVKPYTGIIQNKTGYELSVPSQNSNGTVVIPPKSFVEYTIWSPTFEVMAYKDGVPFHCHRGKIDSKAFPYMCKKYDFMLVIDKEEPTKYKKKRIRKRRARA